MTQRDAGWGADQAALPSDWGIDWGAHFGAAGHSWWRQSPFSPTALSPESVPELLDLLGSAGPSARWLPMGAGTKRPLLGESAAVGVDELAGQSPVMQVSLRRLRGVIDYQPTDFTVTVRAGTPVAQLQAVLAEHRQYLACDPPLAEAGATVGGLLASGWSGPRRLLWGGLRDCVLAVEAVDGRGRLVRGGAPVVKNSAGFDLPKLLVGSLGRLCFLTEVTFKVLPEPLRRDTWLLRFDRLAAAAEAASRLLCQPLEIDAMELVPEGGLVVQLLGSAAATERLGAEAVRLTRPAAACCLGEAAGLWRSLRDAAWLGAESSLVKVPMTLSRLSRLEAALAGLPIARRYSAAGGVAWLGWPVAEDLGQLDQLLASLELSGLTMAGPHAARWLGTPPPVAIWRRLRAGWDPDSRFVDFPRCVADG